MTPFTNCFLWRGFLEPDELNCTGVTTVEPVVKLSSFDIIKLFDSATS